MFARACECVCKDQKQVSYQFICPTLKQDHLASERLLLDSSQTRTSMAPLLGAALMLLHLQRKLLRRLSHHTNEVVVVRHGQYSLRHPSAV